MSMSLKWWLLLCSTLTIMTSAALAPSLPAMASHFSGIPQAETWVKLVIAIPGGIIALTAIALGVLVDRSDKPWLLLICLAVYGIFGCAGFIMQDNLWGILLSRAVLGIAMAGLMVSITTLAARCLQGEAFNRYMGLQAAFGCLGGVVFSLVGGLLTEIGWGYPFLLHGVALVLLLPGIMAIKSVPSLQSTPSQVAEQTKLASTSNPVSSTPSVPGFILAGFSLLAFVEVLLLYVIPLYFPFYLQQQFNANTTIIGAVLGSVFLLVAIVSMNYAKIKKQFDFRQLQIMGLAAATCGFVILSMSSQLWLTIASILLLGAGFGVYRPNLVVWLFSHVPAAMHGKAMGIITTCYFLGQFFSPLIFEPITTGFGLQAVFVTAASISISVILFLCVSTKVNSINRENVMES